MSEVDIAVEYRPIPFIQNSGQVNRPRHYRVQIHAGYGGAFWLTEAEAAQLRDQLIEATP